MGITDQKPHIATLEDTISNWACGRNGKYFRCYLCGHKFQVGDQYRFVFGKTRCNLLVCEKCDTGDVLAKWDNHYLEWNKLKNGKFWHFAITIEDDLNNERSVASKEAQDADEEIRYWKDKAKYPD